MVVEALFNTRTKSLYDVRITLMLGDDRFSGSISRILRFPSSWNISTRDEWLLSRNHWNSFLMTSLYIFGFLNELYGKTYESILWINIFRHIIFIKVNSNYIFLMLIFECFKTFFTLTRKKKSTNTNLKVFLHMCILITNWWSSSRCFSS